MRGASASSTHRSNAVIQIKTPIYKIAPSPVVYVMETPSRWAVLLHTGHHAPACSVPLHARAAVADYIATLDALLRVGI